MALHIRLGKFNYEQDRIDAVNKSFKKRYGHSGLHVIHSSLTLKGKLRKIFKRRNKMERNLSENDRQSINSNCEYSGIERRKGNSTVSSEMDRRKKTSLPIKYMKMIDNIASTIRR